MANMNALEQGEFLAIERPVARISWGGIFIGAIATIALGILFHALGAAIGLTAFDPASGNWGRGAGIATGLWSLLSIVVATFLGAWLAARASTVFFKRDAVSLGLMTWALSFLLMLLLVSFMTNMAATQLAGAGIESGAAQQLDPNAMQQQMQGGAGTAADVGAAAGWWFFASALLALLAGIFGAMAGTPKEARQGRHMEVRRTQTLKPRESKA